MAVEAALGAPRQPTGRLFYCTSAGGFSAARRSRSTTRRAPRARGAARSSTGRSRRGFLAAAPAEDACGWCDFRPVCGPDVRPRVRAQAAGPARRPARAEEPAMTRRRRAIRRGVAPRSSPTRIDDTLVVEAAAGTGKTTELVNRILRVLAEGRAEVARDRRRDVHREGRRRAEAAAAAAARGGAARRARRRRRGRAARGRRVQNLEEAHVSTIHGFCADLLRERPVEARVDPLFRVLTEGAGRAAVRRGVRRLVPGRSSRIRPKASGGRCGAASRGSAAAATPTRTARSSGCAAPASSWPQWRDFPAPWTRDAVRSRRRDRRGSIDLVHALRRRLGRAVVRRRQPLRRHRAGAPR